MQGSNQKLEDYLNQYTEMHLLGRGNYGSAYLVEAKYEPKKYVAKKIMLDGLSPKEVEAAWGEVQILKKLSGKQNKTHCPFVVEYIQSFHFDNTLIIVMEYCENGDLTTFLKNWKKTGQLLDEVVIVNWFIQMVFGVEFLHSKGVLHRDLKAANIFLTSNRIIKIGDFGISKILESTSAKTFVGTPYYLSPEVCENRPYDFRSDLWSLGCILYEMCTFEYPFQSSNILGLAMKILKEKVQPISDTYSPQLNEIVIRLLTKDEKERIKLDEIKMMPYINVHISNYDKDRAKVNQIISKVKAKNPTIKDISTAQETEDSSNNHSFATQAEDTMKTIKSNFQATSTKSDTLNFTKNIIQHQKLEKETAKTQLTPMQKYKLKKQQQADKQIQRLKQQVKKNSENKNFSKIRKQQNLGQSVGFIETMKNDINKKIQYQNQKAAEFKKSKKNQMEKNQTINLQTLNNILQKNKNSNFSDVEIEDTQLPSQTQYVLIPRHQRENIQEVEQEIQEYNDQQFEEYHENEVRPMTAQQEHQLEIIQGIMAIAADKTILIKKNESPVSKSVTIRGSPDPKLQQAIKNCRNQILAKKSIQTFGQKKFVQIYESMKNGSFDFKNLKKIYTKDEQQLLRGIQEMAYKP